MKKKVKLFLAAVIVILFLFAFMPQILHFFTDYLWFKDLGYQSVYLKFTFAKFAIGFAAFILVFALSYITLQLSTKYQRPAPVTEEDGVINVPGPKKLKHKLVTIPSVILGLFAGILSATALWENILLFFNQTSANITEPVFGRDISFYFFNLSLFQTALDLALLFLAVIALSNFILTFYLQGINKNAFKVLAKRIVYFLVAFLVLLIIGFQLQAANLLYSSRGVAQGAGYVDLKVTLPMYYIASVICVVSIITILLGMKKRNLKLALSGPVLLAVVLVVGTAGGSLVQSMVVKPAEISKEQPYIQRNIELTNKAYGLDKISEVEYPADGTLTVSDLQEEEDTVRNIRITDYRPSAQIFNQLQSMRLYYKFVDVDIDRYDIDGKPKQVFVSARELDQASLQDSAQTWINKYLKYTHGYGAVVTPVNEITSQGQPELWVKDIPPTTAVEELAITRPEIYFGQLTNDYVIVNTKEKEFDYPVGDTNAESHYEGDAGINMTLGNKMLFSLDRANYKILFSSLITKDSKILLYRNINERVQKIAPFLTYDNDPYLVVDDGRLVWILDAYTVSDKFPYATAVDNGESIFDGKNYVRNSVKVTVDAYNGETNFYIVDEEDPLIQSYAKVFPGLFKPLENMPANLQAHIKYPSALFGVQTEMYQTYHMQNPTVFYNREDMWSIAKEIYGSEAETMESYYVNMRLPGSNELEYLLMRPFTPYQKDNMVAWLAARNDGDNYGELVLFKFPKQSLVYGPMQIESRINNDPVISQNLTLWDQQGSSVIRGDLLVIPIKDSILYVEPIYLTANTANSLPEVIRIIVAYQDQIVMEKSLDDALYKIFGEGQTVGDGLISVDDSLSYAMLVQQIKDSLANAKRSSQSGDWAEYGQYLQQLESLINQLDSEQTPTAEPVPSDEAPVSEPINDTAETE